MLEIENKIIEETTKCEKEFACLASHAQKCCKVEHSVAGKVLFVESLDENECRYKVHFGYSFMCTCPTRKEIYLKHGS